MATLQRQASELSDHASSVGGDSEQGPPDQRGSAGADGGDAGESDLIKQQASLQESVFGVLFTLSKEKIANSWKYAVANILLDFLQLLVFLFLEHFPWHFNHENWAYKVFTKVQLQLLAQGGGWICFTVFFYIMSAVVVASAGLCIFVAHNFKTNNFPFLWPIKVLRFVVSIFFDMFYISSLALFTVASDCTFIHHHPATWDAFSDIACFSMPHTVIFIVGIIMGTISVAIAFLLSLAATELDPSSNDLAGQSHASVSLQMFVLKTVITVVGELITHYLKLQGVLMLLVTVSLLYCVIRNVPWYVGWVNCFQAGLYMLLAWISIVLFPLTMAENPAWYSPATYAMLGGMPFAFLVGWVATWARLLRTERVAMRFKEAKAAGVLRVRHRFFDAHEVEIVARCARRKDNNRQSIPEWLGAADLIYRTGLQQNPSSAFLHIAYANFLEQWMPRQRLDVAAHLATARNSCNPNLAERFNLFVKDRETKQRSLGDNTGEGNMDLVSVVEFENNYKTLLQSHSDALRLVRGFWRQLAGAKADFASLTKAFSEMDLAETHAEQSYKLVMQRYPKSVKVLHAYVSFLREVKLDPRRAEKYAQIAEAQKLAQATAQREAAFAANLGAGTDEGNLAALMSDENEDAVIMIDTGGIIQFVNTALCNLFGYKKRDLTRKNINMLMPAPFSMQHNSILARYKATGKGQLIGSGFRDVLGQHKDGFVLPLRIAIEKNPSQEGYMGTFQKVDEERHVGHAWLSGEGIIYSTSRGFHALLGYEPTDLVNKSLQIISDDSGLERHTSMANEKAAIFFDLLPRDKAKALALPPYEFQIGIKHKYGGTCQCTVSVTFSGSPSLRILVCNFTYVPENRRMGILSIDNGTGRVVYNNNQIESLLYFKPGELAGKRLTEFLPAPHKYMHAKWRATMMKTRDKTPAASSCRSGRVVPFQSSHGRVVPCRMTMALGSVGGNSMLTASCQLVEMIAGMESWGVHSGQGLAAASWRLRLLVRQDGRILAGSADDRLMRLGMLLPSLDALKDQPLSRFIPAFQEAESSDMRIAEGDALLGQLCNAVADAATGGKPPVTCAVVYQPPPEQGRTPPRLPVHLTFMSIVDADIEVGDLVDEGRVDHDALYDDAGREWPLMAVDMQRRDHLISWMELDNRCFIRAAHQDSAAVFGYDPHSLKGCHLSKFIKMPGDVPAAAMTMETFLGLKRTNLKKTASPVDMVGEKQVVTAVRGDGQELELVAQGADKMGDGMRWILRMTSSLKGLPGATTLEELRAQIAALNAARSAKWARGMTAEDLAANEVVAEEIAEAEQQQEEQQQQQQAQGQSSAKAGAHGPGKSDADAAISDGASQVSDGQSIAAGATGGADEEGHRESYARRKRYKKLRTLLTTPAAKAALIAFQRYSKALLLLIIVLHIAYFCADRSLIQREVTNVNTAFSQSISAVRAATLSEAALVLYSALDSTAPPAWNTFNAAYRKSLVGVFAKKLINQAAELSKLQLQAFQQGSSQADIYSLLVPGTVNDIHTETFYYDPTINYTKTGTQRTALFPSTLQLVLDARLLSQLPAKWTSQLHLWDAWHFIWDNGPGILTDNYEVFRDLENMHAVDTVQTLNNVVLIFMCLYVGLLMPTAMACCTQLLYIVSRGRHRLFSVFMMLPRPTVLALANRSIDVTDEWQAEDADDPAAAAVHQQQEAAKAEQDQDFAEQTAVQEMEAAAAAARKDSPTAKFNYARRGNARVDMLHGANLIQMATLLGPLVVWTACILAAMLTSYQLLLGNIGDVHGCLAFRFLNYHNARMRLFALNAVLTARSNDTVGLAAARSELTRDSAAMLSLYTDMTTGNPPYSRKTSLRSDAFLQGWLYNPGCVRQNASNCYATSNQYYGATNAGLDALLHTFCSYAQQLSTLDASQLTINNSNVLFVTQIGLADMSEGIIVASLRYVADVIGVYNRVLIVEVIMLVLLLVLTAAYFWYLLRPFYKRLATENLRIAELLSQLPGNVDVEGLVVAALTTSSSEPRERKGRRPAKGSRVAPAAADEDGSEDEEDGRDEELDEEEPEDDEGQETSLRSRFASKLRRKQGGRAGSEGSDEGDVEEAQPARLKAHKGGKKDKPAKKGASSKTRGGFGKLKADQADGVVRKKASRREEVQEEEDGQASPRSSADARRPLLNSGRPGSAAMSPRSVEAAVDRSPMLTARASRIKFAD